MINYLIYITILVILFFIFVIAIKAINRGIEAKKKFNKGNDYDKYKNKK